MLRYPKGPAPKVLTAWQATPSADWDSLPKTDKDKVRDALLRDQGHLCAYCDTSRGDAALFLDPIEGSGPSPRDHLAYTHEGEVRARDTPQRDVVQADIRALNMNAARLRRERRIVYEEVKRRLDKRGWSPKALRDEHAAARIEPGRSAVPQCEVARYYVERWARQHRWEL